MRLSLAIVLAVAIAVAVYAVKQPDDSPAHAAGSATLVGDSLNVGIEPYLGDELPGGRAVLQIQHLADTLGLQRHVGREEQRFDHVDRVGHCGESSFFI